MVKEKKEMELSKDELAEVVAGGKIGEYCAGIVFGCAIASPGIPDFEIAMVAMIF